MDPFDSDDEYLERQEAAELDGASLDHGGGGGGSSSPERPAAATPKLPATAPAAASARRRYAFGLFLLMLVVVIWVGAAELMEYIFREEEYPKPFFVTYLSTATFSLHLLVVAGRALVQRCKQRGERAYAPVPTSEDGPAAVPLAELATRPEPAAPAEGGAAEERFSLKQTIWLSVQFCLLWFLANVSSNASLQFTTVTSSTILSSTSGFFTLLLSTFMLVERPSVAKLGIVLISMSGVALVSVSDTRHSAANPSPSGSVLWGDLLALMGAFMYGVYTTLLKLRIGHEDRIDMRLFFGFVGVFNVALLWPGLIILHYTGIEPFELPSARVFWMLVANGVIGTFLSDYLWLLAMLMTSPVVVTLGLSLTIPLAIFTDWVLGETLPAMAMYWSGALLVLASFVFINVDAVTATVDAWAAWLLQAAVERWNRWRQPSASQLPQLY